MKIGWKMLALVGVLIAAGVVLICLGHPVEGGSLTGAGVLVALAVAGVKKG